MDCRCVSEYLWQVPQLHTTSGQVNLLEGEAHKPVLGIRWGDPLQMMIPGTQQKNCHLGLPPLLVQL